MSLRTCLFSRKIYSTNGNPAGTIRVEFIPEVSKKRFRTDPYASLPEELGGESKQQRNKRLAQTQTIPIDLSGDDEIDDSDVSCSSTEEF